MADKRPKGTHNPSQKSQRWDNEGGAPKGGRAKRPRDPAQLAKLMIDIASGEVKDREPMPRVSLTKKQAAEIGGKKRAVLLTKARRTEIAKSGAAARWKRRHERSDA
jgi:hypothetical protein